MGEDWISFPELLRWWGTGLLLPVALAYFWNFELRRMRSIMPLVLLAVVWLGPGITQLAAQCESALLGSSPYAFFHHAFDLPLS